MKRCISFRRWNSSSHIKAKLLGLENFEKLIAVIKVGVSEVLSDIQLKAIPIIVIQKMWSPFLTYLGTDYILIVQSNKLEHTFKDKNGST